MASYEYLSFRWDSIGGCLIVNITCNYKKLKSLALPQRGCIPPVLGITDGLSISDQKKYAAREEVVLDTHVERDP